MRTYETWVEGLTSTVWTVPTKSNPQTLSKRSSRAGETWLNRQQTAWDLQRARKWARENRSIRLVRIKPA